MIRAAIRTIACAAFLHTAPALGIELRVEGSRLVVTGLIEPDDDFLLLTALVARRPTVRIVHFHEMPGGYIVAALRMGRMIRARHLDTIASSVCLSGCAFAFLGGVSRRFALDAAGDPTVLGYHGPFDPANPERELPESQTVIAAYIAEMTGARADPALIERALRLKPDDLMLFVGATQRLRGEGLGTAGVFECPLGRPTVDASELLKGCVRIPGTGALEQGLITTSDPYRLPARTPSRRP